jgi:hypothetical protein
MRTQKVFILILIKNMYYSDESICLSRKKDKVEKSLRIIFNEHARVLKLVDITP